MKFSSILAGGVFVTGLSGAAVAQMPQAQPLQMVPRPTPDADALASTMRRLGANPRDLSSLIEAGELSLRLGDPVAAAALFKRADMIDPRNGRVKAGMARILVQEERPGEALRYFDQAAGYGLDARTFAGDRGLAYDLIGQQMRAQRDYRLALQSGAIDEVQRRYALSLAISGKQADALAQLDPLVRKSDRGAWRSRAFILAMGGDLPGATDIATRMMPPGMATGLQPFFRTLPSLGPVDRAFAVHFGEVRPTPARLADARLAPTLPVLPAEAVAAPVTLAQVAAPVLTKPLTARERRAASRRQTSVDRRRARQQRVQVARAAPVPAKAALPDAPRYGTVNGVTFAAPRETVQTLPVRQAAPAQQVASVVPPPRASDPVRPSIPSTGSTATIASGTQLAGLARSVPAAPAAARPTVIASAPLPAVVPPITTAATVVLAPSVAAASGGVASAASVVTARPTVPTAVADATRVAGVSSTTSAPVAAQSIVPAAPQAAPAAGSVASVMPSAASVAPPPTPGFSTAVTPAVAATTPVAPRMSEDSILARIVAGITIPAEELGVAPMRPAPVVAAAPVPAPTPRPVPVAEVAPKPPAVDPRIAARKLAAEKKAAAAKKLADEKKAAAAKKLAEEKKAKADPVRIWVQVAGGASAADLPRAYAAVQAKAPVLAGKPGYMTPLRFTNRVVTGPYKTDAEARAMVNTLAKQGVSAFTFTSELGQKITRLPPK